jgi:hypothetical protein
VVRERGEVFSEKRERKKATVERERVEGRGERGRGGREEG